MKTAVCLIVRNEARDIGEWIIYHQVLGFDTQIIFDNGSDDGTVAVIQAAGRHYDIRIHDWQDRSTQSQLAAYNAAIGAYRLEFDWMAFIDSDEFLVPDADVPVNEWLATYDRWAGIAVPWAVYGANGHDDFPSGLVTENFTRRAGPGFFPARHVKSIVRPHLAGRALNPHCFELAPHVAGAYCDLARRPVQWWPAPEHGGELAGFAAHEPDYTLGRINHYFTRSRAHWRAKLRRGYPSDVAIRKMEEFDEYNRNDIADPIAGRYGDRIRAESERLGF